MKMLLFFWIVTVFFVLNVLTIKFNLFLSKKKNKIFKIKKQFVNFVKNKPLIKNVIREKNKMNKLSNYFLFILIEQF